MLTTIRSSSINPEAIVGETVKLDELGLSDLGDKLWAELQEQLTKSVETKKRQEAKKKERKEQNKKTKEATERKKRRVGRKASAVLVENSRTVRDEQNDLIEKKLLPQLAAVLVEFIRNEGPIHCASVSLNLGDRDGYHGYSLFIQNGSVRRYSSTLVDDFNKRTQRESEAEAIAEEVEQEAETEAEAEEFEQGNE